MDFRLLHAALPVFVVKKLNRRDKRSLRTTHDVGKSATLTVRQELIGCDGNRHNKSRIG
jgi:hypothetical protein